MRSELDKLKTLHYGLLQTGREALNQSCDDIFIDSYNHNVACAEICAKEAEEVGKKILQIESKKRVGLPWLR